MTAGQLERPRRCLSGPFWFAARDNGVVDNTEAIAAIRTCTLLDVRDVKRIPGGWGSWTFDVDGQWIFRFPRTESASAAGARELRFLPELAGHVDFDVPTPRWSGTWNARPFFGYPRIVGHPLEVVDVDKNPGVAVRLVSMVHQIHTFDRMRAIDLLGVEGTTKEWQRRYADLRTHAQSDIGSLTDANTASLLERGFDDFESASFAFTPTLIHGDLGTDHFLIDHETGWPVGIIDFEDVDVGDPAIDFIGFWITLGPQRTRRMLGKYEGEVDSGFIVRLKAYWWMGALHAVQYGIKHGDQSIIDDALVNLNHRLLASQQ